MLVVTRKTNQGVRIGDSITVTVLRVRGSQVRIGIQAPKGVKILRGELVEEPDDAAAPDAEPPRTQRAACESPGAEAPDDEAPSHRVFFARIELPGWQDAPAGVQS